MAAPTSDGNSSGNCAVIRPRSRFPKAKPNIFDAGRRLGTPAATPVAKPAVVTPNRDDLKSPPPVRRMARLDVLPSVQPYPMPIPNAQPSPTENASIHPAPEESSTPTAPSSPPLQSATQLSTSALETDNLPSELTPTVEHFEPQSNPNTNPVIQDTPPPSSTSPLKKKQEKKNPVRRIQTRNRDEPRRRHMKTKGQVPPERGKMTMFDLIYWNPEDNPMRYEEDECRIPLSNKEANGQISSVNEERLAEEAVDDPNFVEEESLEGQKENEKETEIDGEESMPVPQVKIGPDGSIILDEQSLVIQTSASKKDLSTSPVVYERSSNVTYASFRNKRVSRNWSDEETTKFYMALSTVGTDFSMMGKLFPKRTRNELKLKFKREERINKALVDKAIHDRQQYDLSLFEESDEETENLETVTSSVKKAKGNKSNAKNRKQKATGEEAAEVALKQKPSRKKNLSRKRLQEESDSDFEIENISSSKSNIDDHSFTTTDAELPDNSCDPTTHNPPCETDTAAIMTTDIKDDNTNDMELDEDGDEDDDKLLDGVLKQTRSGRHPKKRAVFTINVNEPKKRQRKEIMTEKPDELSSIFSQIVTTPSNTSASSEPGVMNATVNGSPGHLLVVAENGSQIVRLFVVSPPPQPKPHVNFTSPVAEHDYIQPSESDAIIATGPDGITCIEITSSTLESLPEGTELLISQEVLCEEQLIHTSEVTTSTMG